MKDYEREVSEAISQNLTPDDIEKIIAEIACLRAKIMAYQYESIESEIKVQQLRIALHDAIHSDKDVVPDSGKEFYRDDMRSPSCDDKEA